MPKTWLITGSASGIGHSTAEIVLARGDNLIATARNVDRLLDLARHYEERVELIELDVTDASASRGAVATAMQRFGRLDVLLNNAGYAHLSPFEQISEDDFKAEIDTNFYGQSYARSTSRNAPAEIGTYHQHLVQLGALRQSRFDRL